MSALRAVRGQTQVEDAAAAAAAGEQFEAHIAEQRARMTKTDFCRRVRKQSGCCPLSQPSPMCKNVCRLIQSRLLGFRRRSNFSEACKARVMCRYLPCKSRRVVGRFSDFLFCGTYSKDGSVFMSTGRDTDGKLRFFDTADGGFRFRNEVQAQDVSWAIVDTAYSPDQQFAIYSTWSSFIHLVTLDGDRHEALRLGDDYSPICPFSIMFSNDSREVIAGTNQCAVYVYDIMRDTRTVRVIGHESDINAVAFADDSSQIFFSGSDDMLCKVWDRRTLSSSRARPVGTLYGHAGGITFIDSQGDGRHLLTQSKDQTIKLWDIRKMSAPDREPPRGIRNEDYRYMHIRSRPRVLAEDNSLMTYSGHKVCQTLIRARFSPLHTTGQKYIYSGSSDGKVYIFDVLTGELVQLLCGHSATVRDVSWHPHRPIITTSSWDATIAQYLGVEVDESKPFPVYQHQSEPRRLGLEAIMADLAADMLEDDEDGEEEEEMREMEDEFEQDALESAEADGLDEGQGVEGFPLDGLDEFDEDEAVDDFFG